MCGRRAVEGGNRDGFVGAWLGGHGRKTWTVHSFQGFYGVSLWESMGGARLIKMLSFASGCFQISP